MSLETTLESRSPQNPFQIQRTYSAAAVTLMRALSQQRRSSRQTHLSPLEVLQVCHSLGYRQPEHDQLRPHAELRRFLNAMSSVPQQDQMPYPTCDHLLNVLEQLGYQQLRHQAATDSAESGVPIDRRRNEGDVRAQPTERRSSQEPGAQECMNLTEDEHRFLDQMQDLRHRTGRQFASSEELLCLLWNLGYRPTDEHGLPLEWLDEEDRCLTQIAFTWAVENRLASAVDDDFLTCRSVFEIATELGFTKTS